MATVFTHALVGGLLPPAFSSRSLAPRLVALAALLAVLPDLDVVAFSAGIPYGDPLGHRGFSHSLPFAALAGLGTALVAVREPRRFSRPWWGVAGLLALATASHGLLDALTDAGLGVGFFLPFDSGRYFFPWRPLATSPIGVGAFFESRVLAILFIEVIWVWLPMLAGTALALGARRRWNAR